MHRLGRALTGALLAASISAPLAANTEASAVSPRPRVALGHGHAEGGSDSFYLYLGRTF